jgi:hypothetical protein
MCFGLFWHPLNEMLSFVLAPKNIRRNITKIVEVHIFVDQKTIHSTTVIRRLIYIRHRIVFVMLFIIHPLDLQGLISVETLLGRS